MNERPASCIRIFQLFSILLLVLLLSACKNSAEESTVAPRGPERFKARFKQSTLDQVYDIEVVPVGSVHSRSLSNPIKTPSPSNKKVASEPVRLPPITPIVTTPGEGQYKEAEVVAAIDSPYIGKLSPSKLAGDPQLRDENPAGFGSYNALHGLRSNLVFALHQDRLGNIWIGTYSGGVTKYDGKYMTTYSEAEGLPAAITHICESKDGTLWLNSPLTDGFIRYDGFHFSTFTDNNGLVNNVVNDLMVDPGDNLWICTNAGISKFDGKQFTNFTVEQGFFNNTVYTSTIDKDGHLWFGMPGALCKFDGSHFYTYSNHPTFKDISFNSDMITDQQGQIWISTTRGLLMFDGESFWDYANSGLPQNSISDLFADDQDNLWICTINDGIYQYAHTEAGEKKMITHFDMADGLNDNNITCGIQDNRGNYWFGTNSRGVNKYQGSIFQHREITKVRGLTLAQSNQVWVATYGDGVYRLDEQETNQYTIAQGLSANYNQIVYSARDGSLWIGTWGAGIDYLDGNTLATYTTTNGLISNYIVCITEDHEGNIWIGTTNGISKFDGTTFTNFKNTLGGMDGIWDIFEDSQQRIWIAQGTGLMMLDDNHVNHYEMSQDLGIFWVVKVLEDHQGNIWLASNDGGLVYYDVDYFYQYTDEQGLSTSSIFSAILAENGEILTVNDHGLNRVSISPNQHSIASLVSIKEYLHSDGFLGVGSFLHSISQDTQGVIWIGTYDRVTAFNPEADVTDTISPSIQLRNVLIFNESMDWLSLKQQPDTSVLLANGVVFKDFNFSDLSRWYSVPLALELSPRNNYLTFQFIGITPKNSDKVKYQYFLEGLDRQWSTVNEASEASYNNLPHGHYTFKVKAVNSDGYWSDELSYSFSIRPPWWFSTTAYIFYGLLFIFGVWRVHTYQRKRVIRKERMKAQKKELEQAREIEKAYQELKSTQTQLIHAEKMASLGELTAGIAHEIQNPLNFVNNFSEVSNELIDEIEEDLSGGKTDEAQELLMHLRQNLEKINHHGVRADGIVKGMLLHSRSGAGEKELTDINALCDEYLRLAYHGIKAREKGFSANYELDLDPELPKIKVVPQDIGRVLLNLINNAFQAVSGVENGKVSISTRTLKDKIEVTIADNGHGIPEEIKDKIFQPFFTTKATGQGTGLGLSLSYDIVKAHGGDINVQSKEGEGCTFSLYFPVHE